MVDFLVVDFMSQFRGRLFWFLVVDFLGHPRRLDRRFDSEGRGVLALGFSPREGQRHS